MFKNLKYGCLLILFSIYGTSMGQTFVKILDKYTNEPLIGAYVVFYTDIESNKRGVSSGVSGQIKIPKINGAKEIYLEISFLGYVSHSDTAQVGELIVIHLERNEIDLETAVVTAQYAPTDQNQAIRKVDIITKEQITAMGAVSLRDVLVIQNQIRISQDQVLGSSMSLQGIGGEKVKILMDGVPIIGRQNGNIDLSQINLNNTERIEIVNGPLSVNYGSNALAGTINLISKKTSIHKWEGSGAYYYESVGQYNVDGRIAFSQGKHLLQLSGGRNYFNGWDSNDELFDFNRTRIADTNRFREWKPKEQYFAEGSYNYNFGKFTIRPFSRFFHEKVTNRGRPRQPYEESAFDEYYKTKRIDNGIALNTNGSGKSNFRLIVSFNSFRRIKETFYVDLTNLNQQITSNPEEQDTSHFKLGMSRFAYNSSMFSTFLKYEIGYDVNYEIARGYRIENKEQSIGDYALFGSLIYNPSKQWTIQPGVRASYNTEYNAPVSPSVNVKYNIQNYTIRTSYAKGFRAPSLKELYFEFIDINHNIVGNADLLAEQSNNYQLDVSHTDNKQLISSYSAGVFYNDIENLITLAQSENSTKFSYFNVGEYRTKGIQADITIRKKQIEIKPAFVFIGRYNSLSELKSVDDYNYSPEINCIANYRQKNGNVTYSLFYKYTGRLQGFSVDSDNNLIESIIEDYNTLDLSVAKPFWEDILRITLGGKNLFDVRNINSTSNSEGVHSSGGSSVAVAWGRSLFLRVQLNLKYKNE